MTTDHATPVTAPAADDAILDALQDRMERIIRGDSPNTGRFCGYCYARLGDGDDRCALCRRPLSENAPLARVPRDALRAYDAYRRTMRLWVNVFAFLGIFIAVALFTAMIVFLPNPWIWFAVPVLFFGSWYFANLFAGFGALIGVRKSAPRRTDLWRQLLQRRAAGENLDG